jgi:hypothetical protein
MRPSGAHGSSSKPHGELSPEGGSTSKLPRGLSVCQIAFVALGSDSAAPTVRLASRGVTDGV